MESVQVISRRFRVLSCGVEARTEDEFLGRRKHVKRESHLILVLLLLHPLREVGGLGEKEGQGRY